MKWKDFTALSIQSHRDSVGPLEFDTYCGLSLIRLVIRKAHVKMEMEMQEMYWGLL